MAVKTKTRAFQIRIGEEWRGAHDGETIEAINPANGETIASFPRFRAAEVDEAVATARSAFPAWRDTSPLERAATVRRLADVIVEHAEELALLDVADNGSPIREMRADAHAAAASLRYYAGLALELHGQTIPGEYGRLDYTLLQPFGVVGRIIPFNHPLMFAGGKIAAPLVAGNTVVIKPSEHTSLSALRLGELAADVLPPGVLTVITGYGDEAGDALVTHPEVRRLAFIGSVEIGRAIQRRAAEHVVKTVTLELGGKNPLLILPDADLDLAVAGALRGMNFTWQGQSCGSTSRLFVHSSLHGEFVQRLAARMDAMRSGPPDDEATETGAIVHRRQFEKVLGYLEIARQEGLEVAAGGGAVEHPGLSEGMFIRPTLYDKVAPSSRLFREEIFGPVLVATPFDSFDEAIEIANSTSYGLTASVFTNDLALAHRFARDIEAGYVWINDVAKHIPGVPFGGFKDSGVGREESFDELVSYTQVKNVNVNFGQ